MAQLLVAREFVPLRANDLDSAQYDWMFSQVKRALLLIQGLLIDILKGQAIEADHYLHQLISSRGCLCRYLRLRIRLKA